MEVTLPRPAGAAPLSVWQQPDMPGTNTGIGVLRVSGVAEATLRGGGLAFVSRGHRGCRRAVVGRRREENRWYRSRQAQSLLKCLSEPVLRRLRRDTGGVCSRHVIRRTLDPSFLELNCT